MEELVNEVRGLGRLLPGEQIEYCRTPEADSGIVAREHPARRRRLSTTRPGSQPFQVGVVYPVQSSVADEERAESARLEVHWSDGLVGVQGAGDEVAGVEVGEFVDVSRSQESIRKVLR